MRIIEIEINEWRNFRNIKIQVPEESTLICLVGENGTGKSNILELISSAAHRLGISPGIEIPRGDPFSEKHSFSVAIKFDETIDSILPEQNRASFINAGVSWNGIIRLVSRKNDDKGHQQHIMAEGKGPEDLRQNLGNLIVSVIRQHRETNYLSLDADRAYPPIQVQPHEYAQALERDWEEPFFRKQRAFIPTRAMYDEWIRYFLAKETQDATKLLKVARRAKEAKQPPPEFVDGFEPYKDAVQSVLPHLKFVGVDTQNKTIVFDSSGLELRFTSLSGGEREIAFIIGQIERFQLRHGILLIDEPELHLNPDLVRNWVAHLRDTVVSGQVWICTHSLEAVEAAGPPSTFVLERTMDTRIVEKAMSLSSRPVLSVLSAALGSPAFSLRNLRFVYIEGDRQGREKERFYSLYGDARFVRFVEGGGCEEVIRKLSAVRELAEDADEQLRVGGVIDRDFRTDDQIAEKNVRTPVFVLGCHEIENMFLHPEALQNIADRSGIRESAFDIIRDAADRFAGLWVLRRTVTTKVLAEETKALKQAAGARNWQEFDKNRHAVVTQIISAAVDPKAPEFAKIHKAFLDSVDNYEKIRNMQEFWKKCMGKEVLGVIPHRLGLQGTDVLENQVLRVWAEGKIGPPNELTELRNYIDSIK